MKTYGTMWWTAARHWTEISAWAPLVIGERLLSAASAGPRPSMQHQAEMTRMVMEKGQAAVESSAALWLAAFASHQLAWQRAWRAGRPLPLPADYTLSSAGARGFGHALRPISRRVTANARRLAARKRKAR